MLFMLQEKTPDGSTCTTTRLEVEDIESTIVERFGVRLEVVNYIVTLCRDFPGMTYDLFRTDDQGVIEWAARLTLVVEDS